MRASYFRLDAREEEEEEGWGAEDAGEATYSADLEWEASEGEARPAWRDPTAVGVGEEGEESGYYSDEGDDALHLSVDLEGPAGGAVDAMDVIKEADHEEGTPFAP